MPLFKALVVLLQCNKLEVVKFFATYPGHHLEQSRFGDPECQNSESYRWIFMKILVYIRHFIFFFRFFQLSRSPFRYHSGYGSHDQVYCTWLPFWIFHDVSTKNHGKT